MSIHEAFGLWSSMQFEDHGWTPLSRKQVMQTAPPPNQAACGSPQVVSCASPLLQSQGEPPAPPFLRRVCDCEELFPGSLRARPEGILTLRNNLRG